MPSYDRVEFVFACPGCKREVKSKFGDVYGSRQARCQRCSAQIQFDSGVASALRSALGDLGRAQEKVDKIAGAILERAQIKLK